MPPWLSIAIPCVLFVLTVASNLVFLVANLKLKFGSTQEAVTREWKQLAFGVGQWLLVIVQVGLLAYIVLFIEKVTHLTVAVLVLGIASLLFQMITFFIKQLCNNINAICRIFDLLSDSIVKSDDLSELRLKQHKIEEHQIKSTTLTPS